MFFLFSAAGIRLTPRGSPCGNSQLTHARWFYFLFRNKLSENTAESSWVEQIHFQVDEEYLTQP